MEQTYTQAQLVSFGEYLLSEKRKQLLLEIYPEVPDMEPYETARRKVYDADIRNWGATPDPSNSIDFTNEHQG